MSSAFNTIILLVAAIPVLGFMGNGAAISVQLIAAAIGLLCVAVAGAVGDAAHFRRATSGVLWAFALPSILILLQLLPLPLSMSHPIWASASEALQTQSVGHITVDMGLTLDALFTAVSLVALIGVVMIVARDRRRAELLLFAASAITTLVALSGLLQRIFPSGSAGAPADVTRSLSGLGIILNLSTILLVFERRETRLEAAPSFMAIGIAALASVAINTASLLAADGASAVASTAFGVTLLVLTVVIRRLDLAKWPTIVLGVAALVGAAIMVTFMSDKNPDADGLLRFLPAQPSDMASVYSRMLGDGRWLGSGAGAFEALAQIYQSGDAQGPLEAPTTAIAFTVEIGWIGLAGVLLVGLVLAAKLIAGALMRGRDSFFPAAAAAGLIAALCEIFLGAGLLHPSVAILLAVVTGVGLAQAFSQSARQ